MLNDSFTIKIFVPDGDPESVRIIERTDRPRRGIFFPREKWKVASQLPEFGNVGVYILFGDSDGDEVDPTNPNSPANLPTVYIGEGDGIRARIDSHFENKDFWSWGIAFVSTNQSLNKAHVQWLEYSLVKRAGEVGQCKLDNGNTPQEPALTESEKAETRGFLREILQVLPLVGLRAFETPKAIFEPKMKPTNASTAPVITSVVGPDTIVVPARIDGFNEVFLGKDCWYAIRISGGMLPKIRWIAGYQTAPKSAITHIAPVGHIERYGEGKKYKVVFSEPARPIGPIPRGDNAGGIQGPCYTTYSELVKAKKLSDLFGR
ncbi:MAG: GIY-YIG nuclease family protein [Tepidisphaeraceae bacterium]